MGSANTDSTTAGLAAPRPARAGVRFVLLLGLAVACPLLASCHPNKRYDLLEAELRTRDREVMEARAALERSRAINHAYEQSRPPELPGTPPTFVPTGGGGGCMVREIAVGRGTGGLDEDGVPGDEALMVVIVPTDEDKSAVKVPARATISAWEITPQGLKNPIGSWDVSAEHLRPTWRSGLIATGYFVTLPWQTVPTTERVRVAVRLTATDGRAFEADRDVSVRPAAQPRPALPIPAPPDPLSSTPVTPPGSRFPLHPSPPPAGVPTVLPPGVEELPPPAGLPPAR